MVFIKKRIAFAIVSSLLVCLLVGCKSTKNEYIYGVIEYGINDGKTSVFLVMPVSGYDKVLLEEVAIGQEYYRNGDVVKLSFDKDVVFRFYGEIVYLNTYPVSNEVLGGGVTIKRNGDGFSVTVPRKKTSGDGNALSIINDGKAIASFEVENITGDGVTVKVPRSSFDKFFGNYDKEFVLAE